MNTPVNPVLLYINVGFEEECLNNMVLARCNGFRVWHRGYKTFFMLNKPEHTLIMLINIEIAKIYGILGLNLLKAIIYLGYILRDFQNASPLISYFLLNGWINRLPASDYL